MLTGAKAQEYDRLRQLGHTVDCAYAMADTETECACKQSDEKPAPMSSAERSRKRRETKAVSIDCGRKRGRPRKYVSGADKQAAYRSRKIQQDAADAAQIIELEVQSQIK